jgi:hypothetical protein
MNPHHNFDDELFEVERKIARRADQLARDQGTDPNRALEHWKQAEREVWASMKLPTSEAVEEPHPVAS